MQKLLSYLRRAVDQYQMIQPGDRIAVGVSGGKDSLTLLCGLASLRRFYPNPFELTAITLEMGFDGMDFSAIQAYCEHLQIPYIRKKTQIQQVIFEVRQESNPCSLCAKMRRGALHETALENGIHKVALGHHFDDVVETYLLSLFYEGTYPLFSTGHLFGSSGYYVDSSPDLYTGKLHSWVGAPGKAANCVQSMSSRWQYKAGRSQKFTQIAGKRVSRFTRTNFWCN